MTTLNNPNKSRDGNGMFVKKGQMRKIQYLKQKIHFEDTLTSNLQTS